MSNHKGQQGQRGRGGDEEAGEGEAQPISSVTIRLVSPYGSGAFKLRQFTNNPESDGEK